MPYNGTTLTDLVGGNTGTLTGGVAYVRDRHWGGKWCLNYDGTGRCTFTTEETYAGDFSALIWFAKGANGETLWASTSAPSQGIDITSDTTITVSFPNAAAFTVPALGTGWHALLITRSGSSLRLYLDGVESSTGAITNSDTVKLGDIGAASFTGRADDARTFDRAILPAEVKELYRRGYQRHLSTGGSKLFICPSLDNFGADSGDVALDLSGEGQETTLADQNPVFYVNDGENGGRRAIEYPYEVSRYAKTTLTFDPSTGRLSIGGWFKCNAAILANGNGIVSIGNEAFDTGPFFILQLAGSGLRVYWGGGYTSATAITLNVWHHFAWVFDGSVGRLYLDGADTGLSAATAGSGNVTYVFHGAGYQFPFHGWTDDLLISQSAWTPEYIATLAKRRAYQPIPYQRHRAEVTAYNPTLDIDGDGTAEATDLLYSGNTLTLPRSTMWAVDTDNKGELALVFNGTSDIARMTTKPIDEMSQDWTVSCWFKRATTPTAEEYIYCQGTNNAGSVRTNHKLSVSNTGVLVTDEFPPSGGFLSGVTNVCDGSWHHIAVVHRPGYRGLFVDGVEDSSDSGEQYTGAEPTTDWTWGGYIKGDNTADQFLAGSLDSMRIFDRGLFDEELAEIANQGRYGQNASYNVVFGQGLNIEPRRLEANYRHQDTSGNAVTDQTARGRNGTATSTIDAAVGPKNYLPNALNLAGTQAVALLGDLAPAQIDLTIGGFQKSNAGSDAYLFAEGGTNKADLFRNDADNKLTAEFGAGRQAISTTNSGTGWESWVGTETAAEVRAFLNGVLETTTTGGGFDSAARNSLTVGTANASAETAADTFLFTRALYQSEAAEHPSGPEPLCLNLPQFASPPESGTAVTLTNLSTANGTDWLIDPSFAGDNGLLNYDLFWYVADDSAGSNAALVSITTYPTTYTPTAGDETKFLQARVRGRNTGGWDTLEDGASTPYAEVQAGAPADNNADAVLTGSAATFSADATFTAPFVGNANATLVSSQATFAADATFDLAGVQADAVLVASAATFAAAASAFESYTASATLVASQSTLAATASHTDPVYRADAVLTASPATFSADASYDSGTATADAALTATKSTFTAMGSTAEEQFRAFAPLVVSKSTFSALATYTPGSNADAVLIASAATIAATASHVPPVYVPAETITVDRAYITTASATGSISTANAPGSLTVL